MRKLLTLLLLLITFSNINAQILTPVKWESNVEKVNDSTFNLIYKGNLQKGWHLYSQHLPEDGALPTEFIYDEKQLGNTFNLQAKDAAEGKTITHFDKVFEKELTYFDDEAIFVHQVILKDKNLAEIIGEISFQMCDDESCLFDSSKLTFNISSAKQVAQTDDSYVKLTGKSTKLTGLKLDLGDVKTKTNQIFTPVKWDVQIEKISATEFDLLYTATIEKDWHIYSNEAVEDGPIPTTITFNNTGKGYELEGKIREGKGHVAFEEVFDKEIKYFEGISVFRQKIKTNIDSGNISSELEYMACSNGQCLPPEIETFNFKFKNGSLILADKNSVSPILTKDTSSKEEKKKTNWTIFLGTLLAGILVTFTPCVFPMIPMTVSFFLKHNGSDSSNSGKFSALFYGFCIIFIYVLISVPFHLFESLSPDIFNEISTNVYLNLFFFIIFFVFAISFLGAFEITMPSSLANKVDGASNKGGLIGVFFMALTLIIVSFSCTGPALGLVLGSVLSTDGGATILSLAMFGFGLGLALPFMIFALFPSLMKNMPKSGGWLNTVKVVFGFIELALAFKFLSNADLVLQLHFLEREVFIGIWVAIFGALALYLFGKIQLPHDSPLTNISVGRLLLGLVSLAFTIYLIPGLWGAPLKLISGLPPSMVYSESPYGVGFTKLGSGQGQVNLPDHSEFGPHDIISFDDYEHGLAYAKEIGKPVLIDFTGYACVNCRKMEDNVWSNSEILNKLKNDIVLISLHVDDKRDLPKDEQYVSKVTGKTIRTIGNKWSEFSIIRYKANVQPYYVLMGHDEKNLNEPVGYTPDVEEYSTWIQNGISKFKK